MTDSVPPENGTPDTAPSEDLTAEAARMLRKIGWEPSHLDQIRVYARMEPARKIKIMLRFRAGESRALRNRLQREHPEFSRLELAFALRRELEMSEGKRWMSKKRYFKRAAESGLGPGVVYLEFDGEWATRQVEVYGDRWFCSLQGYHPELGPGLVDQPLSVLELRPQHEISEAEFEEAWQEAFN